MPQLEVFLYWQYLTYDSLYGCNKFFRIIKTLMDCFLNFSGIYEPLGGDGRGRQEYLAAPPLAMKNRWWSSDRAAAAGSPAGATASCLSATTSPVCCWWQRL